MYVVRFFNSPIVHKCPTLAQAKALVFQLKDWTITNGSNVGIGCNWDGKFWAFSSLDYNRDASKQLLRAFKKSRKEVTDDDAKNSAKKLAKNDPLMAFLVQ